MSIRYASVCSGVEAASLAWMPLGWECVWVSEIEPFPCAVLKKRLPNVPNLGDMTQIKGENYRGTIDLLVGGTPCQGFSVAGKQGGLDDPRSALCLAFTQLLKTMRPRWFVWENVPGVFNTGGGADFRAFLAEIDEIGYSVAWRVLDAQYVRVDGYPRAVPQRRRRVFVIGHIGTDWRYPASVLFEPDCLHRDTPPRRITGKSPAGTSADRAGKTNCGFRSSHPGELVEDSVAGSIKTNIQSVGNSSATLTVESGIGFYTDAKSAQTLETHEDQRRRNIICVDVAPTLDASYPAHLNHQDTGKLVVESPKFWNGNDVAECLTAKGADDRMPDKGKLPCVICAGFSGGQGAKAGGIAYEEETAPTIKASPSGSNQAPDVVCFTANDYARDLVADVSPTLRKGGETVAAGGAIIPAICQYGEVAGTLEARHDSSPCADRGQNIVFNGCLTPHDSQSIRIYGENGVFPTLKAGNKGGLNRQSVLCVHGSQAPNTPMIYYDMRGNGDGVTSPTITGDHAGRPTDYTPVVAISGNIIDRKEKNGGHQLGIGSDVSFTVTANDVHGVASNMTVRRLTPLECERLMGFPDNWTRVPFRRKPAKDCPDSPRYKACGNSMCVNVMRWIGMRIELVERKLDKQTEE